MKRPEVVFITMIFVFIITALSFGKLGEAHVLREQKIEQNSNGYVVTFEGKTYNYDFE